VLRNYDVAKLAALEAHFTGLADRLNERGIRLIVVGYPDKSRIYPEKAPPKLPLAAPGGNYDKFRQFLASQSDLTFIDAEALILREKQHTTEHLYAMTDMHTTDVAQLLVVKEIIAQIARAEGRPDIRWNEDFTLTHQTTNGGSEERFLSLLVPTPEDKPYFVGEFPIGAKEPDGTWVIPDHIVMERADDGVGRPFDWEFRSNPDLCPQRLPGMVLFGNSFSDAYWALGLQRYFCFSRRARDPISRFQLFYDTIPPGTKYFIYEYYSAWLNGEYPPFN
jgi:hypothetical protein